MSEAEHPFVDVADIVRLVGRMSFDRARAYSRAPALTDLTWDPANGELSARVRGTHVVPYRCRVSLAAAPATGRFTARDGTCTCPVQYDCKHVAAMLLASNAEHLRERAAAGDFGAPDARTGLSADDEVTLPTDRVAGRPPGGHRMPGVEPFDGEGSFDESGAVLGSPYGSGSGSGSGSSSGSAMEQWYPSAASLPAAPAREADPTDWRSVVGRLTGVSTGSDAPEHASKARTARSTRGRPAQPTRMGLQFEIREIVPRTTEQWRGPVSRPAKAPGQADDTHALPRRRLGVRPVVQTPTGSYIKANVTWTSFSHQINRLGLEPAHHRWFSQFAAVHRATRELFTGHDTDWVYLDDFESPLLWQLLFEAERLGIRMLGTRKNASITVSPLASVRLEAVTLPSGDLQLTPVVVFGAAQPAGTGGAATRAAADATSSEGAGAAARADQRAATATTSGSVGAARKNAASVVGSPAEGDSSNRAAGVGSHGSTGAGSIGDHGLYVFELAPLPTVRLAPLAGALSGADAGPSGGLGGGLSAEVRAMLRRASDIVVPAAEVAEFLEDFYPTLRRAVDVTSSDATIVLPEIEPPLLVLTARFRPKNVLALDWAWQYGGDRKPTRLPLHAGDDEGDEAAAGHGSESRDTRAEQAILARVAGAFTAEADPEEFFDPAVPLNSSLVLQGYEAAVFTEKTLPSIEAVDGVRVDVVGKRPDYRELTGEPEMTITTVESDKRDWFDLGIIVNMGGYQIPFGPLFKALSRGEKKLLMVDKTYLSLEHPAFDRLRELLTEANSLDEWETGTRISRYQASLWADLEELADETVQAVAWRAAVSGLNEVTSIRPVPVPLSVQATLRPYQQEGFQWLAFLHEHGLGGVLADDMGLGKTLQTLTLIAHARTPTLPALGSGTPGVSLSQPPPAPDARPPFLVVAPTSVVSNWVAEATRFTPGLEVRGVTTTQSKGRLPLAELAAGADVVVTSYALFRLDFEVYQALEWSGLILDEAQFIKNHTSKIHRCATDFDAPFKLAITGTPLENNLMELWSLFAVVAPGLFPSAQKFTEGYVRPIERAQGDELLPKLRRRIRPLLMRRTKELVAPELPAKQEQVLQIALAPAHRALYDTFFQRERQKLLGLVEDLDRNRFIVFRSLTLLRMLSLDASLIDEKYSHIPSSKLDALFEQLDDVIVEGHRALIFSQFTSFLGKAATRMAAAGIAYEYLDGSTTKRADVIARFKTGTAPVFLISLKAGGFGLNLTEADYVFLLDPWWNPATESQAIDRTHRIGQSKSVNVYRLVAGGTIEEKVMALKEQKAKLFDTVMDDDAVFSSALTADDIRDLLDV